MTDEDALLAACEAALADGDVVTDPDRLPTYTRDRSTGSQAGEPIAVVFPRTTEQVSAIMKAAHQYRIPVVPRGAGSGLSGVECDRRLADCLRRENAGRTSR